MNRHRPPDILPPAKSPDFAFQTRLYATKPLPDLPPQHHDKKQQFKRKPVGSDERLVGQTAGLPMAGQKQDAAQDQELDALSTQGRSLSTKPDHTKNQPNDNDNNVPRNVTISPPPKSPRRYGGATPSPKGLAQRRRSSAKVQQLTGIDIDVFNESPWKYEQFPMDDDSETSSIYSQDSTGHESTMKSWRTGTDEVPPAEGDQAGPSRRSDEWGPRLLLEGGTLEASLSLRRKPRTHRKSRDRHVLDNYHQIVTDLASPSRASVPDLPTITAPSPTSNPNRLRAVKSVHGVQAFFGTGASGMPEDFDIMCNDPRQAPRPPPKPLGPDGERQGSYFDVDSDEEDRDGGDGIFSTSGRARDSFLNMLLWRGSEDAPPAGHQRSGSASTGGGRRSSEADIAGDTTASGAMDMAKAGSKRKVLKDLVGEWKRKDGDEERERERRRQELRSKITIQGGRRI